MTFYYYLIKYYFFVNSAFFRQLPKDSYSFLSFWVLCVGCVWCDAIKIKV